METLPLDIKLIAIDLDGTLLNPQHQVTPRTLEAVQAARQEGIIVTLATARRYLNTSPIADTLGLDIPLILCDGALIMQHPQRRVLHTQPLEAALAQQAVEILVEHGIQPAVHHINGTVEEMWTGPEEYDNAWIADYFAAFPAHLRRLPYASLCAAQPDPLRVVAFASEEVIYDLVPEVSALDCSWNAIKRGNFGSAEMAIMHTACSKASGVKTLVEQLGIPTAQIMAIGDNNNDLEMLEAVGWGVAMGHAPDAVKCIARAITASNTEDGVALAIERYALRRSRNAASNSFKRNTCL